jgi:integrase
MPLSDTRIRNAKAQDAPYKLTDAKGLYLEVRPTGAKLWRYRYRIGGKENVYALGEHAKAPDGESAEEAGSRKEAGQFTLEEARIERVRLRGLVRQGIHPVQVKRAQNALQNAESANTFETLGREWLAKMKPHWSAGHHDQVKTVLEGDVFPSVGALPVRQVSARMIGGIMESVEARGAAVTAINIRQWASAIFALAVRKQAVDGDPTGVLKGHVKRPVVKHKTPLTQTQIPEMVQRLGNAGAYPVTKIALRLLLLLFVRPGEMRRAEWSEFDLGRAEWTIPAAKMKKREVHVVPLPAQAVALLRELHKFTGGQRWLFPNHRRPHQCMSDTTLNQALRRIGYENKFSAHGFRATASTMLHEMGHDERLIDEQLAHKERNRTKASYNQYRWIKERRAMVQQWADMIDQWMSEAAGKVSSLKRRAA